ncbi:MAG TPA: patatin-like phospholipase family protein [Caulobacteraceae bacterium]
MPRTALRRLFDQAFESGVASWFSLPGGAPLFLAGEAAEYLYLLRTGRLGAVRRDDDQESRFLGMIRPGEPAGEMALITGSAHTAEVVALRDSEVLALPRALFLKAAESEPALMGELARLSIGRARQTSTTSWLAEPSAFGFVGVARGVIVRPIVEAIARAIEVLGYGVAVVGTEALHQPTEWFSNLEHLHDFVLYAAESDEAAWRLLIGRQADRLFNIAAAAQAPAAEVDVGGALHAHGLVDLILLQQADCPSPQGSAKWVEALEPARLFQLRASNKSDIERLARVITGQAVGLVLSGGGARAYAHIGAVRALRARGVPIDFVAGVSMGAIIGAGVAMGWDDAELYGRIRKAFVDTSPLDDIALPFIAMTHGDKVRDRLAEHFGETQICDLWLPFFCISSNLTSGVYQLHKHGLVREALRASVSIPGVLPPVIAGNDVLVDGAVMKNFPADIMRDIQPGPIVGVDVSRGRSIEARDVRRPASIWRWLLSGEWRKGPPIISLLMRAATVTTGPDLAAAREATDVLVLPAIETIEIRDWKAIDAAAAKGEEATLTILDGLWAPVTALRRRPSLKESRREP